MHTILFTHKLTAIWVKLVITACAFCVGHWFCGVQSWGFPRSFLWRTGWARVNFMVQVLEVNDGASWTYHFYPRASFLQWCLVKVPGNKWFSSNHELNLLWSLMKSSQDQFWEGYRLMALSQLRLGRIGLACLSYDSRLGAAYREAIHEDMVRGTSYKYREQIWYGQGDIWWITFPKGWWLKTMNCSCGMQKYMGVRNFVC